MAEWHLDPVYIADNWTDEMLGLMVDKLAERKKRMAEALAPDGHVSSGGQKVSDSALFQQMSRQIKVIKKGA